MSLITTNQLNAIRSLGEKAMIQDIIIRKAGRTYSADDTNPFGDDDLTVAPDYQDTTVKGWLISNMGRTFDEDGGRIVAIHDFTLRVPHGTDIEARDLVFVDGREYVVTESNVEDGWAEWTECYLKRID